MVSRMAKPFGGQPPESLPYRLWLLELQRTI
jgi:hypothetical protein